MTSLREQMLALPRRIEPISGQNFSYVKLDDVLALTEAVEPDTRTEDEKDYEFDRLLGAKWL